MYIFGTRPNTFTPKLSCTNRNDIISSRWFFNPYRKYLHLPKYLNGQFKFMCVPIILFIDEIHLDRQGSATICPVLHTLGIFSEATKKNPHAWRHLGFIPKDVVRAVIGNTQAENKRYTLGIFSEATKKNPHAWRHLGFIPKDVVRAVIGNTQAENKRYTHGQFYYL